MADKPRSTTTTKPDEPRIVAAVGTAVNSDNPALADQLEMAQVRAVEQAIADGVSLENTDEILKRKAEARERVLSGGT
jgi:hypothetical protein